MWLSVTRYALCGPGCRAARSDAWLCEGNMADFGVQSPQLKCSFTPSYGGFGLQTVFCNAFFPRLAGGSPRGPAYLNCRPDGTQRVS